MNCVFVSAAIAEKASQPKPAEVLRKMSLRVQKC
jgi:hypothetical protein